MRSPKPPLKQGWTAKSNALKNVLHLMPTGLLANEQILDELENYQPDDRSVFAYRLWTFIENPLDADSTVSPALFNTLSNVAESFVNSVKEWTHAYEGLKAQRNTTGAKSIVFPDTVRAIGNDAMKEAAGLTSQVGEAVKNASLSDAARNAVQLYTNVIWEYVACMAIQVEAPLWDKPPAWVLEAVNNAAGKPRWQPTYQPSTLPDGGGDPPSIKIGNYEWPVDQPSEAGKDLDNPKYEAPAPSDGFAADGK